MFMNEASGDLTAAAEGQGRVSHRLRAVRLDAFLADRQRQDLLVVVARRFQGRVGVVLVGEVAARHGDGLRRRWAGSAHGLRLHGRIAAELGDGALVAGGQDLDQGPVVVGGGPVLPGGGGARPAPRAHVERHHAVDLERGRHDRQADQDDRVEPGDLAPADLPPDKDDEHPDRAEDADRVPVRVPGALALQDLQEEHVDEQRAVLQSRQADQAVQPGELAPDDRRRQLVDLVGHRPQVPAAALLHQRAERLAALRLAPGRRAEPDAVLLRALLHDQVRQVAVLAQVRPVEVERVDGVHVAKVDGRDAGQRLEPDHGQGARQARHRPEIVLRVPLQHLRLDVLGVLQHLQEAVRAGRLARDQPGQRLAVDARLPVHVVDEVGDGVHLELDVRVDEQQERLRLLVLVQAGQVAEGAHLRVPLAAVLEPARRHLQVPVHDVADDGELARFAADAELVEALAGRQLLVVDLGLVRHQAVDDGSVQRRHLVRVERQHEVQAVQRVLCLGDRVDRDHQRLDRLVVDGHHDGDVRVRLLLPALRERPQDLVLAGRPPPRVDGAADLEPADGDERQRLQHEDDGQRRVQGAPGERPERVTEVQRQDQQAVDADVVAGVQDQEGAGDEPRQERVVLVLLAVDDDVAERDDVRDEVAERVQERDQQEEPDDGVDDVGAVRPEELLDGLDERRHGRTRPGGGARDTFTARRPGVVVGSACPQVRSTGAGPWAMARAAPVTQPSSPGETSDVCDPRGPSVRYQTERASRLLGGERPDSADFGAIGLKSNCMSHDDAGHVRQERTRDREIPFADADDRVGRVGVVAGRRLRQQGAIDDRSGRVAVTERDDDRAAARQGTIARPDGVVVAQHVTGVERQRRGRRRRRVRRRHLAVGVEEADPCDAPDGAGRAHRREREHGRARPGPARYRSQADDEQRRPAHGLHPPLLAAAFGAPDWHCAGRYFGAHSAQCRSGSCTGPPLWHRGSMRVETARVAEWRGGIRCLLPLLHATPRAQHVRTGCVRQFRL